MTVTVNRNNFLKALQATEKIISRNLNLPILSNILIRTEQGRLRLSSTNLEIGVNYWIGAKIEAEGEIAVPARIITDFMQSISDDRVTLTTKKNTLLVNSENFKTQILGFETNEFPIIPTVKSNQIVLINSQTLKNSLNCVVESTSISETRPELTGVFGIVTPNRITFAATDGFRLAEISLNQKNESNFEVIVPRATIYELIRIIGDLDEDLEILVSENQILVKSGEFNVLSRLIEGRYPDYKKIIPNNVISRALFNKDDLQRQIKLSSLFSSSVFDIKIEARTDKTIISAQNQDKGEIHSSIASILKNEPFQVSLNYNYFLDGLKVIDSKKIIVEYTGEGSPLVLKPEEGDKFIYLIMPIRQ
ncbi:MAG: DNA polymerase III subunit beta [Candidatus Yanofskybacteria bacterium CG10_big_fil_rev_8_21_14_0_10_46_23]|uniref:Beta sliding clamp n=1 Tax=Candidatus Yanofskybacteria bacterium CG10_big_fil_rev_8_21_14_0_10_46_23 TaxID=1975098 RepID=A0A2H0R4H5_9BACT|nr:MAG: DNA polymerase III subunit beta [Candidatus Yanofskybacteria bacterium CG10_big_fil_rev_8_21_14_0_10_46_23]